MARPDNNGAGLVNLIASLAQARGGPARHPILEQLQPAEMSGAGGELLMNDRFTIKNWTPGEPRHLDIGNHGGASAEEMMIPLVVAAT